MFFVAFPLSILICGCKTILSKQKMTNQRYKLTLNISKTYGQ
jgi:hypothetical protein